jgi:HSP20 family protein
MNNFLERRSAATFPGIFGTLFEEAARGFEASGFPALNITEHKDRLQLEMAVPGFKKEEIRVKADENRFLRIEGDQEKNDPEEAMVYRKQEFSLRNFSRSFRLGKDLNADEISAACENGILRITIPKIKAEHERSVRHIPLQ